MVVFFLIMFLIVLASQIDISSDSDKVVKKISGRVIDCEVSLYGNKANKQTSITVTILYEKSKFRVGATVSKSDGNWFRGNCKENRMAEIKYKIVRTVLKPYPINRLLHINFLE